MEAHPRLSVEHYRQGLRFYKMMKMKTRAECLQQYGSDYMIRKKVNDGELYEVGKAVFSEEKNVPEIAVLAFKYPNSIITMNSAFYLHGLTDVIPDEYDLATERDAAKIRNRRVKQYFVPEDFFVQEVEESNYKGYPIRLYSKERMLIELLRYKSKLPFDYYKEILLNYRKILPRLNIQEIQDLAYDAPKRNKIMETLQTEVL